MEQKRLDFILTAASPIAHAQETLGNVSLIMRRKIRQPDGTFEDVPCVSADAMRHGLREAATYALLDAAGMIETPALTEAALRLLFSGGMVTGRGDASTVKLDAYREMIDLLPPLALLGGCASNRVIPGRMAVDDAVLICEETMHLLPDWVRDWVAEQGTAIDTARAHVEEVQRVRMDPTLDPGKRRLLTVDAQAGAEQRLLASEKAHEANDAVGREESKSSMMPRRHERVVQGALFYWSVVATTYSPLDADTFMTMVGVFLRDARVGGKRGTGHGQLRTVTARQVKVVRPREKPENLDVGAIGPAVGSVFYDHVRARAEQVREFLGAVDA